MKTKNLALTASAATHVAEWLESQNTLLSDLLEVPTTNRQATYTYLAAYTVFAAFALLLQESLVLNLLSPIALLAAVILAKKGGRHE